jgi:hypothetical protein
MPAPFAALEAKVNAACRDKLANAAVTWGSYTASGILDSGYADRLGLATREIRIRVLSADLPAIAQGASISVDDKAHYVRGVEPDGPDWLALVLERA